MTQQEVKTLYPQAQPLPRKVDGLTLLTSKGARVAGREADLGFFFLDDDRLARVMVRFPKKPAHDSQYITDYEELQKLLTEKYGPPVKERTIWKEDLFRDDRSRWHMAVAAGHLVMGSEYATAGSKITVLLFGREFKITLTLSYESKELGKLIEAARDAEKRKGL
ncbi:MAG TPA: hypothetical protein VFR64_20005 [Methylomirabilota bacterium]|nr:hypothetical protein [Methylomirabilota bacterium]